MNKNFMIQSLNGPNVELQQLTEVQMREVDRIAVEEFGLALLQMMENAGRNLAMLAIRWFDQLGETISGKRVVVAAGSGGNGGGGLCAGRHLRNHGGDVSVLLAKSPSLMQGAAKAQWKILAASGVRPARIEEAGKILSEADLVLDALIGYSLKGAPYGVTQSLIESINASGKPVLSLDIPSGVDATDGTTPGIFVQAAQTLTLALPKSGLVHPACGKLFLADIGIPPEVYLPLGIRIGMLFAGEPLIPVEIVETGENN